MSAAEPLGPEAAALADAARQTGEASRRALDWVAGNPDKVKQEAAVLARALRKATTEAAKLEAASRRPMCVGVFGPSQSGKSYLISALARKGNEPLLAVFDGRTADFVAEINPEGGQESTGLVTRFTVRPVMTPPGLPVALRLLSAADLVKILGNTYYSDLDLSEETTPTPARILDTLDALQARATQTVTGMTEDDVWDLQEYFDQHFRDRAGIMALGSAFWSRAATLVPKLSGADRARLFGLVWNELQPFSELFADLHGALERLNFAAEGFCALDALIPRGNSIIDVRTLSGLGKGGSGALAVVARDGARADLQRAQVTALIAELTIVMREPPRAFFAHTDLLDFPGARSRENHPDPAEYVKKDGALAGLFLRGKVAYLFQRYAAEQELNAMVLCLGPSNQEVASLPRIIADWVALTHGNDPDARARQRTALFLALTKFDMEFEEKSGQAAQSSMRWTARLDTAITQFLGKSYDWPRAWQPGKAFANTYWIRNPNVRAKHIIDYDDQGAEIALRAGESDRVARMRAEFLDTALVRSHFADPGRAWDEALTLNDGGVGYLAEQLTPVCDPAIKRKQIEERLSALKRHLGERLGKFHVGGSLAEQMTARRNAARQVAMQLVHCAGAQRFGLLLRRLQVTHDALVDAYWRVQMLPAEAAAADARGAGITVGRGADPNRMMAKLFGNDAPAATSAPPAPSLDQADRFADAALAAWMQGLRGLNDEVGAPAFFAMQDGRLETLADELIAGAQRLGLREAIAGKVRKLAAFRQRLDQAVTKPVLVAETSVNGYIDWLGFDKVPANERPRAQADGPPIFAPKPPVGDLPPLGEEPTPYDEVYYVDWIAGFLRLVEDNVRVQGGKAIDIEQNARLGAILSSLS